MRVSDEAVYKKISINENRKNTNFLILLFLIDFWKCRSIGSIVIFEFVYLILEFEMILFSNMNDIVQFVEVLSVYHFCLSICEKLLSVYMKIHGYYIDSDNTSIFIFSRETLKDQMTYMNF